MKILCITKENAFDIVSMGVERDGIVSTVTRYELDGPGIESQWG
jgi:hypothetical protein